jgi:hypothetical protein
MADLRQAAQQALEALINSTALKAWDAITALRAALAQEEQTNRAQQMRDAGYTRRPTLREMGEQEREDIAQNLQSRLDAALLLEGRRQEIAQPCRETEQEPVAWTDRELELIDGMIEVQLHHAAQCDAIANRTMAEKQKGWDMERVALLHKIKSISPRREWRGLTMQEINALPEVGGRMWNMGSAVSVLRAIRAVEAKLKEKNNG